MGSTFFTLTSDYRVSFFRQIHEICFYGKGGYSWDVVYNMPLNIRRVTWNFINQHYEEEKEQREAASGKQTLKATPKGPNIKKPTYSTKASN